MMIRSMDLAHLLGIPLTERDLRQEAEVRDYLYPMSTGISSVTPQESKTHETK